MGFIERPKVIYTLKIVFSKKETKVKKTFPQLTQTGRIGSMQLKNRMLVTAMGTNLAEADGSCGDRIIAYHERQAQGGAGLIVIGVAGVGAEAGAVSGRCSG